MPIYEYECPDHGIFEKMFQDPKEARANEDSSTCKFFACLHLCERAASLPSMQPDKYWAGKMVFGKYCTSKKEVQEHAGHIAPLTRSESEYVAKRKTQLTADNKVKNDRARKKAILETMQGVETRTAG